MSGVRWIRNMSHKLSFYKPLRWSTNCEFNHFFEVIGNIVLVWRASMNLLARHMPSRQLRHSGIFIVNFEHISHLVLVFLLLIWAGKYRLGIYWLLWISFSEIRSPSRTVFSGIVLVSFGIYLLKISNEAVEQYVNSIQS